MVSPVDRDELRRLIEVEEVQVVDGLPEREDDESHISGPISVPLRHLTAECWAEGSRPALQRATDAYGFTANLLAILAESRGRAA